MTRISQICLSAAVLLAVTAPVTWASTASNPFAGFEALFEPPPWHHKHVYRSHKPVPVKATVQEGASAPVAAPAEKPTSEVPDAILPIPEARPIEPASAAGPPIPAARPAVAQSAAAIVSPVAPKSSLGKSPTILASLTPPADTLEEKPSSAFANLAALGVKSVPHPPIEEGRCTVLDPVSVSSLEGGAVPLSGQTIVNDRMAETFARWVHYDVVPAAHDVLAGQLTGIRIIGSYSCRARYDAAAHGKMSEHGFADALDVAAFRIDKRWIEVGGDKHNAADDARFLDTIRHAACRRFTTVLGPGEPLHDTHFHLDLERRGKTGRYTICE